MAKEQDLFDLFIEERELRQSGQTLLPSYENGLTTVREQTFVDTFDSQVKEGVQSLFEKFTLNEQTKEDLKKGGEVVEGIGKGLFEGGIVNPLGLIVDENSKFMQDAKQATEFNPDFDFANFGYEGAKFFGSYLGLGKLMAIGKVGTQLSKLGTFGKEAVRSLGSTFTAYEGTDENLVDAIMSMGADPDNYPMIRKLMTDPNDSDFEGRLKNVLADLPVEALVPRIAVVLKNIKSKAPPEVVEQSLDNLKKEGNELLDKYSVGSAINPKGELAQSIIEQADKNTNVSKLAPNKGEVVNLKPKKDRLNFYSKAEEVTNQLKQNKGTGQQYRQQLLKAGVKPDEIEWLGLDDVLNKDKISKQELQDQINANRIELDEVELSGGGDDVLEDLTYRFKENFDEMSAEDAYGPEHLNSRADEIFEDVDETDVSGRKYTIDDAYEQAKNEYDYNPVMKHVDPKTGYTITGNDDSGYSIFRSEADSSNFRNDITRNPRNPGASPVIGSLNEAIIRAEEDMMQEGVVGMAGEGTRFGEYTEPGGDNYREFLIKYDDPKVQFDESHFDESNVIAHFRTKDRTTSDGKKVFYIEEIQSDWGQQFRTQKGFLEFGVTGIEGMKDMPKTLNEFTISRVNKDFNYYDWFKDTQIEDSVGDLNTTSLRGLYRNFLIDPGIKNKNGQVATFEEKLKVLKDQGIDVRQGPPKAPFITDTDKWTQLTLKRILSKAVDEGYDFVSITPGKAQMDRWNDEGVAKFYDEIVPKNAEKIVKKLDKNAIQKDKKINYNEVRQGTVYNQERFSIELTPQLKEKVKKGMAMFSATPLIVGQENE